MTANNHSAAATMTGSRLYFDAILHPNRRLTRAQFRILMLSMCAIAAFVGLIFASAGAWPVGGFLGLDVLAIYLAFRLNYRSGRRHETVQLSERELTIRKVRPSGRSHAWTFNPYWVRVVIENRRSDRCKVMLSSHGRRISVGGFLTSEERLDFATALENALYRLRSTLQPT